MSRTKTDNMIKLLTQAAISPTHPNHKDALAQLEQMKQTFILMGNQDAADRITRSLLPKVPKELTDAARAKEKDTIRYWFTQIYEGPRSQTEHADLSIYHIDFKYDSKTRIVSFNSEVFADIARRIVPYNNGKVGSDFSISSDRDGNFSVSYERIESDAEVVARRIKAHDSIQLKLAHYYALQDGVNDAFANYMIDLVKHNLENLTPDKLPPQ